MSTLKSEQFKIIQTLQLCPTAESAGFLKQTHITLVSSEGKPNSSTKLDLTNNTWTDVPYNTTKCTSGQ